MYLYTKSGKKLVSIIAAISAFIVIEGAGASFAVNAASAAVSVSQSVESEEASYTSVSDLARSGEARSSGSSYGTGVVTASYLNVRSGPGTGYSIVGGLSNGTTVTVIDEENGWYKINLSNSKTGWVSSEYVKMNGDSSSSTVKYTGVVTASYLNARSGPGTSYSVIGGFSKGSTVTVLDESNGWYKVNLSSSKTGWVLGEYVKINNSGDSSNDNNTSSQSKKIVITASSLNARSGASTSSAILGTVNKNEVYTYTSVNNGWYLIKIPNGKSAYVCGEYVKPFSSYPVNGGGSYVWPLQTSTNITSYFGERNGRNHNGIDIAAGSGSQIIAAASGKVITKSYDENGYGYYIVVEQNDGILAYYAHMKAASFLSVGDTVKAGDTVGMVGSTGNSTGNHLHLEFRSGSTKLNPLNYYPNMK